ncbi:helix-turn-helix domain-containing protein [Brevibacillus sp. SYSU BS000544]|uniref:helix-turn-helix domain-containing protein n=1 Tax=Brevibacillus sp. SYSU BS000544 TaxID=3416443 RepID=UPI003CE448CC
MSQFLIGKNLRLELFKKGMSQEEFGEQIGYSQGTVSLIVTNKKGVTMKEIGDFAKVLQVKTDVLLSSQND